MFEVYSNVLQELAGGEPVAQLPGWLGRRMVSSEEFRYAISALTNSVRDYELFRRSFVLGDNDSERELIRLSSLVFDARRSLLSVVGG